MKVLLFVVSLMLGFGFLTPSESDAVVYTQQSIQDLDELNFFGSQINAEVIGMNVFKQGGKHFLELHTADGEKVIEFLKADLVDTNGQLRPCGCHNWSHARDPDKGKWDCTSACY